MIRIRPATAEDVSQIQSIASESWTAAYSGIFSMSYMADFLRYAYDTENLSICVADSRALFLVAVSAQSTVGFCHIGISEKGTELLRLYIVPLFWRAGIGSKLLDAAEGELRIRGVISYGCFVHAKNERAKRFYMARGFVHVSNLDGAQDWWMNRVLWP